MKSLPKINGAILFRIIGALLKLKPPQNTMLLSIQWGTVLLKSVENEAALQDCTFRCKNLNYLKSTVLELFFQNFDLIF